MRVHIAAGPTPLPTSNAPVVALCAETVRNPYPEMMVEVGSRGLPERNPMRDCAKCWELAERIEVPPHEKFYYYWVHTAERKESGNG